MAATLKVKYVNEIAPALNKKFGYKSVMQIPKLDKVIVNVGCGESKNNAKEIEAICKDLATITGQKPITRKARKSVANFKLREGETVGVMVTLRGDKMYEFLDRLFGVALPRVRDFRGINPNAFDGRGNYAMGLKQQAGELGLSLLLQDHRLFSHVFFLLIKRGRERRAGSAALLLPRR